MTWSERTTETSHIWVANIIRKWNVTDDDAIIVVYGRKVDWDGTNKRTFVAYYPGNGTVHEHEFASLSSAREYAEKLAQTLRQFHPMNPPKEFTVMEFKRDNMPELRVTCGLIAKVSSRGIRRKRWTDIELYQRPNGAFVIVELGKSAIREERTRYMATLCPDVTSVIAHLGHGLLAKDLYRMAGIESVEVVA